MSTNCLWCHEPLIQKRSDRVPKYCNHSCATSHRNKLSVGKKKSEEFKKKISDATKGDKNPMFGKKHSEETKRRYKEIRKGRPQPESSIQKWRDGRRAWSDEKKINFIPWNKGRKGVYSEETLQKMRKSAIKHMIEIGRDKYTPNFNPKACKFFEKFDIECNTKGQFATEGGESCFFSEELDKFVYPDYINHDLKLIMEWYEKGHEKKGIKEYDKMRENAIKLYFDDYDLIIIRDYMVDSL